MGFISKGEDIIIKSGGSTLDTSFLFKRLKSDGSWEDATWGSTSSDFDSAITSSTWTTYGAVKYINVGLVRQIYVDQHNFDRNTRFDSMIRLSNTVTPSDTDLSGITYITGLVRGGLTDAAAVICQRLIDEYTANSYDYVIAIGTMKQAISDVLPINIDVNDVKTFEGSATSVQDYTLSTSEAVYLVNLAICTNAFMEDVTSLSINVFQESFIEFYGDNEVIPGSIGKTQMNPNYKAERAVNNFIMTIDAAHIVSNVIILSPDYTTQIDDNTVYFMRFTVNSVTATKLSLGIYDTDSETYIAVGKQYDVTYASDFNTALAQNLVAIAVVTGDTVTIRSLL